MTWVGTLIDKLQQESVTTGKERENSAICGEIGNKV